MVTLNVTSLLVIISITITAIIRIIRDSFKNLSSLIANIILGGIVYVVLNIMGFSIMFNLMTCSIIVLLGLPGIALIIFLKIIFGIF